MRLSTGSKGFLVVLVLIALLTGAGLWSLRAPSRPAASKGSGEVPVVIPEGAGVSDIGGILEREGIIRSATAFRILARLDGRGAQIQAGEYRLRRGMGLNEVLDVLAAGPPAPPTFVVTIPEGLTVHQTLQRIADAEGSPFTVEELVAALPGVAVPSWVPVADLPENAQPFEGLLFPETYEFRVDASAQDVLARLVQQTDRIVWNAAGGSSLGAYKTLTLASLVEREAKLPEERPRIASVIYNRLEQGIRLQIDATVLYALGGNRNRVLREDLQVDSPWNTYRNEGLPPTPISGVGEASIQAAAYPADEDFLYYVVEDPVTGRHRFSRTFAEHQRAIAEIRGG